MRAGWLAGGLAGWLAGWRAGGISFSPEHNVLMVSFCDHLLSVVRRPLCRVNIRLVNSLEATFIVQSS
ncbi:hypothetical protein DPMN_034667 [Dreissena polymorpha]|uniref:Secreted protein n=1 Tax=Dreissena polymorpha TaxID=45954 RepID=A0A9D4M927_DREPO|nr:hypothetical protein DPMN_034667 [Dreissena polymorpha]